MQACIEASAANEAAALIPDTHSEKRVGSKLRRQLSRTPWELVIDKSRWMSDTQVDKSLGRRTRLQAVRALDAGISVTSTTPSTQPETSRGWSAKEQAAVAAADATPLSIRLPVQALNSLRAAAGEIDRLTASSPVKANGIVDHLNEETGKQKLSMAEL